MRESLDQMIFVMAAYGLTIFATFALVIWSWLAMQRAEKRREESRRK